jgi:hypothetical protein
VVGDLISLKLLLLLSLSPRTVYGIKIKEEKKKKIKREEEGREKEE